MEAVWPVLTKRLVAALGRVLGPANVVEVEPKTVFEDFAEFNLAGMCCMQTRNLLRR